MCMLIWQCNICRKTTTNISETALSVSSNFALLVYESSLNKRESCTMLPMTERESFSSQKSFGHYLSH